MKILKTRNMNDRTQRSIKLTKSLGTTLTSIKKIVYEKLRESSRNTEEEFTIFLEIKNK